MIYTVNGPIQAEEMGVTLSHEHLAWEGDESYAANLYFDRVYDEEKVEHLYEKLLPVFEKLYRHGCRTVVETSPPIGGQNLKLMQKLSRTAHINIVPNTGWILSKYVFNIHKENFERELAQRWIDDFEKGLDIIDDVVIRPGHIKLLFSSGSLMEVDIRMLKAAVTASKATGLPVHCHILEAKKAGEVLDFLEKEEFDFSKFLWAHAGREGNFEVMEKAAAKGAWLGFDMIKKDDHVKYLMLLEKALERGYQEKVLLSQDYDFYEEVREHGENHPCASFFTGFLPYCESRGIPHNVLMTMIIENPRRFYDI